MNFDTVEQAKEFIEKTKGEIDGLNDEKASIDNDLQNKAESVDEAVTWLVSNEPKKNLLEDREALIEVTERAESNDEAAACLEKFARSLGGEVGTSGTVVEGIPVLRIICARGADLNHLVDPLSKWTLVGWVEGDDGAHETFVQIMDASYSNCTLVAKEGQWYIVTSEGNSLFQGDLYSALGYIATNLYFTDGEE